MQSLWSTLFGHGTPQLQFLRAAVLAAFVLTLALVTYAVFNTPSQLASRLGLRGLKRQRVRLENEAWAAIEPVVRWLGVRLSGILSAEQRAELDKQIALAGDYLGLTADEYLALILVSTIAGTIVGAFTGWIFELGGITVVVGAMLGGCVPYLQISGVAQERLKSISRGLPYVIDLMALSMSAGLDFPGALRQVVEKSSTPNDPLIEELTLILQTMNLGRTRREALLELAARAPIDAVIELTSSLVQAEERGNAVSDVLTIQATASRMRRSVRAEEMASRAGVKMVAPLMLVFFCIMGLILGPALMNITEGL